MLVRFEHSRHVTLRGVTLHDPASFTTFFVRSENIQIENVVIRSRNSPNGDAMAWRDALTRTLSDPRCRFVCVFNWESMAAFPGIAKGIQEVVDPKP